MTAITTPLRAVPSVSAQVSALAGRTLRDRWRSVLGWTVGLALMTILQLAVYPSVAESSEGLQSFVSQWPETIQQAFGLEAYTTAAGYLNAELFSMLVPLVLIAIATGGGAAATAGEEERGTADLLLSMPISRSRVLLAKILATLAAVLIVATATFVTIVVGAPLVDLDVDTALVAAGTLMTILLALVFGAVALLVGAATGRRGLAIGAAVGLALAAFLLNALAPMADWLEPWQRVSPFHWALADNPLVNGVAWHMAALLIAVAVVLTIAAHLAYGRRDIGGR